MTSKIHLPSSNHDNIDSCLISTKCGWNYLVIAVSAKYVGLSDKSSKNWSWSSKKLAIFKLIFQLVYGKDEVQDGKMSSKRLGLFVETLI